MLCALCQINEANKKNTHYLTDSIIRSCLNEDGSNVREKGFYFNMSSKTPYVNFNFQRGTSIHHLEQTLGRVPTDEEIEKAKQIPFSVDYIFCSECEEIFTSIENPFIERILPIFRENDHEETADIASDEVKIVKMFYYLQVWRTAICEETFTIDYSVMEDLRSAILNYAQMTTDDLPKFPIHITYLNVTGEEINYTSNLVGSTNDRNPNIIIMNDFVIQFFENEQSIRTLDFHGLNDYEDYLQFINISNSNFKFKVFNNVKRLEFLSGLQQKEKVQKAVFAFTQIFVQEWISTFRGLPNHYIIESYLKFLSDNTENLLQYTEVTVKAKTKEFIENLLK
ncbi:hypothetical protein M2347_002179 [Chryseobacterium sp. H1D6B]|uniref:hypothetical protein n=1 Tax=Chryseobacterium sp. H1D6B TaxID=2940588 RepID=UPI0015CA5205|nr:hypothetical protein [Chryseobacterium sp. H1D6B]MDH6252452.1 hypothetical protein [Chryseobacterium sp. H1D6B]